MIARDANEKIRPEADGGGTMKTTPTDDDLIGDESGPAETSETRWVQHCATCRKPLTVYWEPLARGGSLVEYRCPDGHVSSSYLTSRDCPE